MRGPPPRDHNISGTGSKRGPSRLWQPGLQAACCRPYERPVGLGLLGAEAWLLVQLVAQNGRLLLKPEALEVKLEAGSSPTVAALAVPSAAGLQVGSVAPDFSLPGL